MTEASSAYGKRLIHLLTFRSDFVTLLPILSRSAKTVVRSLCWLCYFCAVQSKTQPAGFLVRPSPSIAPTDQWNDCSSDNGSQESQTTLEQPFQLFGIGLP